ncbi:hypothetical protein [Parvularcula lutaonensis]|uniref:DUF3426 domain-containing protein n=1 Tax=Parvularcula lutaonensis TaxID=491923 RepID=A0ABV7MEB2_9PROT|nr:hypothetical protein [Parvularcula lutaonensis]GGY55081.1 hypothetical protein GCM10007148_26080 [Parvularcula lutaonensis]
MTLPAWRDEQPEWHELPEPRLRKKPEARPGAGTSPANQLLAMLEEASLPGAGQRAKKRLRKPDLQKLKLPPVPSMPKLPSIPAPSLALPKKLASWLLGWSVAAMALSLSYLTFETLNTGSVETPDRPALDFSDVQTRYVQSSEGPAIELSGVVRNEGDRLVEPEVVLQLAGSRVAIEEPVRLGGAALPPKAERPFTLRVVIPEGVKTVRLLPPDTEAARPRPMPLVSPAWTAEPSL